MVILSAKFQPNRFGNKKLTPILKLSLNRICRIAQPLDKSNWIESILSVREITKSSSTFSATNTSSNILWSISAAWYNPNEIKWNLILVPNLVAFISQKEKNFCFFDYHSLTCSVRKMVLICLMQNIDMYVLYKSHQIARLVSHLINHFSKWMFTV